MSKKNQVREYKRFVRKVALGLVTLTDAQKQSKSLMDDAWKERQRIQAEAEAKAKAVAA